MRRVLVCVVFLGLCAAACSSKTSGTPATTSNSVTRPRSTATLSILEPKSGEYKVKGGMVQPTHGVSLYNDPARVAKWGTFIVMSIPSTLKIIQRGNDQQHFEIVPVKPMTEAEYKAALAGVQLQKYEEQK